MATKKATRVFVFKVTLKGNKRIWRRIAILGNQSLDDLHEAIYDAFDRYDEHLYSFYFLRPGVRGRNRLEGAVEIAHPMCAEDPGPFAEDVPRNAVKMKIESLKLSLGQTFEYLFDFGDSWWHEITVEQIDGEPDRGEYSRIVETKGKSPPQYPDLDENGEDNEDDC
jgi:Plasmid pRiA4b ORF-3-like protein